MTASTVAMDRLNAAFLVRQRYMMPLAVKVTGDVGRAEELVQQTFYRALTRLPQYDLARPIGPWLKQILYNLWKDRGRDQHRHRTDSLDVPTYARGLSGAHRNLHRSVADYITEPPATGPEACHAAQVTAAHVALALAKLPPHQRIVDSRVLLEQRHYREVADVLRIPEGTVRSRLSRAKVRLRRALLAEVAAC